MSDRDDGPAYEPFDLSEEPNAPTGCEHRLATVCPACQEVLHDLAQAQRRLAPGPERDFDFDCVMGRHKGCFGYVSPLVNWRGLLCTCECHAADGNAPDWQRALERAKETFYSEAADR